MYEIYDLQCGQNLYFIWTGIYELFTIKLIVPLGLYEGYANFTLNYNRKYEQRTK